MARPDLVIQRVHRMMFSSYDLSAGRGDEARVAGATHGRARERRDSSLVHTQGAMESRPRSNLRGGAWAFSLRVTGHGRPHPHWTFECAMRPHGIYRAEVSRADFAKPKARRAPHVVARRLPGAQVRARTQIVGYGCLLIGQNEMDANGLHRLAGQDAITPAFVTGDGFRAVTFLFKLYNSGFNVGPE